MLAAIRRVLGGEIYVSERLAARLLDAFASARPRGSSSPFEKLSDREFEVFLLFGEGKTAMSYSTIGTPDSINALGRPQLLLLNDDPLTRELDTHVLNLEGYDVETAGHGADSLQWLEMEEFPGRPSECQSSGRLRPASSRVRECRPRRRGGLPPCPVGHQSQRLIRDRTVAVHRAAVETTITATGAKSGVLLQFGCLLLPDLIDRSCITRRADPNRSPLTQEQAAKVMKFTPREFHTGHANPSAPYVSGAGTLSGRSFAPEGAGEFSPGFNPGNRTYPVKKPSPFGVTRHPKLALN
jgi:CheY-like chemotaxis protein